MSEPFTGTPVAVSIVSHAHGAMVGTLLEDLAAHADPAEVILTHNVPEPPVVESIAASEAPEEPIPDEAIAARFAVAFRPETWQEAELSKAIAAFAPRLAGLARRGRPPAAIPWPALDGMTPIRLTPTLLAYAWSNELSLPDPAGFERAAAATRLSQLMQ